MNSSATATATAAAAIISGPREALGTMPNPLGLAGIEFVEYATRRPQALGQALERMGFVPVARHRSREVLLYRQGDMNIVINAHQGQPDEPGRPAVVQAAPHATLLPGQGRGDEPVLSAVAFRVRDAASAFRRVLNLGAWAVPTRVEVMELNIPAIHGPGASRFYFVDRWREFSIYDVDFVPIPGVNQRPPARHGLNWFGVVQYIGYERLAEWQAFYQELFGFQPLPPQLSFGVLTEGSILASPCGQLYWQLIEPALDALEADLESGLPEESLERFALCTPQVLETVADWRAAGLRFVEAADGVHSEARGALTLPEPGSMPVELVHRPA